jgi:hypothetical protein
MLTATILGGVMVVAGLVLGAYALVHLWGLLMDWMDEMAAGGGSGAWSGYFHAREERRVVRVLVCVHGIALMVALTAVVAGGITLAR